MRAAFRNFFYATLVAAALTLGGCAGMTGPVPGLLYSDVRGAITATARVKTLRFGRASAVSYLGLVAVGDASIEAAMKNGGITVIHHVDYELKNYAGLYSKYTVIVYGE